MPADDTASIRRHSQPCHTASAEASSATRQAPRRRLRVAIAALVVTASAILAIQGPTASSSAQPTPAASTITAPVAGLPATTPTDQPATSPAAPRPRVAYVGDSIGHSAEAEVRRALAQGYRLTSYDSVDGTTIAEHLAPATRLLSGNAAPEVLVVELGTNDAEHHGAARFERDLRTMLDLVSPRVREVRWLDQKDTPTYYAGVNRHAARFNAILRRVVAAYPRSWTTRHGPGPRRRAASSPTSCTSPRSGGNSWPGSCGGRWTWPPSGSARPSPDGRRSAVAPGLT